METDKTLEKIQKRLVNIMGSHNKENKKFVKRKLSTSSSADTNIVFKSSWKSIASWSNKAFFTQLGKINKRQKHSRCGKLLGTKFFTKALSNQKLDTNKYFAGAKTPRTTRNSRIVEEV